MFAEVKVPAECLGDALSLWLNTVCGGLERLLEYIQFNSIHSLHSIPRADQAIWVNVASAYVLRLISRTGKRV